MSTESRGLCWTCGYNLTGIPSQKCPECGSLFDPSDPKSMHMGTRPISRGARRLLNPPGKTTVLMAGLATLLLILITGLPSIIHFGFIDLRYLLEPLLAKKFFAHPILWFTEVLKPLWSSPTAVAYIVAISLWALLLFYIPTRLLLRALLIRRHRIPRQFQAHVSRSSAILLALFLITLLFQGFGWPNRLASHFVAEQLARPPVTLQQIMSDDFADFANNQTDGLSNQDRADVENNAANSRTSAQRTAALAFICLNPDTALPILRRRLKVEPDPKLHLLLLRLLALADDEKTLPQFLSLLDSSDPELRATASDAIAIARGSPSASQEYQPLALADRIPIRNLVESNYPNRTAEHFDSVAATLTNLPALREKILHLALTSPSPTEQDAARRVLVTWPPENYQLRYAEWGVWLAGNARTRFGAAVLADIPPLVHRTGNSVASMGPRLVEYMPSVITKPVVHLTAPKTMCVNLKVQIQYGRPLFVYPRPDDFSFTPPVVLNCRGDRPLPPALLNLRALDPPANMPPLTDLHSGIPWTLPKQNIQRAGSNNPEQITAWGYEWDALLITPQPPGNGRLPAVPNDAQFLWWKNLRNVPSSYVTNQNETERFLYYDGPTNAAIPVNTKLINRSLRFTFADDTTPLHIFNSFTHQGLYVEIENNHARAARVTFDRGRPAPLPLPALKENAPHQLLSLLTDAGLTAAEAQGFLQSWQLQFFQTPGKRFLLFLTQDEYSSLCPLVVTPQPTTTVRVGIILTEFP